MYGLDQLYRKGYEILASSILETRVLREWVLEGHGRVRLPFYTEAWQGDQLVFSRKIRVHSLDQPDEKWVIIINTSGNSVLFLDDEPFQGIDEAHAYAVIPPGEHRVSILSTPYGFFGTVDGAYVLEPVILARVDWIIYRTGLHVLWLADLVERGKAPRSLANNVYEALLEYRLAPRPSQIRTIYRMLYGNQGKRHVFHHTRAELPSMPPLLVFTSMVYGEATLRGSLKEPREARPLTRDEARRILEEINRIINSISLGTESGEILVIGHAHLDAAWLWPIEETKKRVIGLFSTFTRILEDYPGSVIAQSSSQYYAWLKDRSPSLFNKVRKLVEKRRLIPVGGMWVETDTNLVSGETLARQLFYGQLFLLENFGKIAKIGWLPDSFGYSSGLPQLLRKAGVELLVIHKVLWNDTNTFPYHSFTWEGADGSQIAVEVLVPSYAEPATLISLLNAWEMHRGKDSTGFMLYVYGYGDGGGGPTYEMEESLRFSKKILKHIRLSRASEEKIIEKAKNTMNKRPVWRGELYVEKHRGTYTTNIGFKELFARVESLIVEAETLSTLCSLLGTCTRRQEELDRLWQRLLLFSFHDILPGSSIREVYEDATRELREIVRELERVINSAIRAIAGEGRGVAIFNPIPWRRRDIVLFNELGEGLAYDNKPVECQEAMSGKGIYAYVEAPGLGYRVYTRTARVNCATYEGVYTRYVDNGIVIGNNHVRVHVSRSGDIVSIRLRGGIELLREPSNKLIVHPDTPGTWDAWDIGREALLHGYEMDVEKEPEIVEEGGLVACIEYSKRFSSSKVTQRLCIYKDKPFIDIFTVLNWRDKGVLLKTWISPSIAYSESIADAPYSLTRRPVARDPLDALFEVPALRWLSVSDSGNGLSIISPSRHGYTVLSDKIGLSLLKSPLYPNPWSDIGVYSTRYVIYPYRGDPLTANTPRLVEEIMHPLRTVTSTGEPGVEKGFLEIEAPLILGALKLSRTGHGIVARIFNASFEYSRARACLGLQGFTEAHEIDLLERPIGGKKILDTKHCLKLETGPLEIKTLLLKKS